MKLYNSRYRAWVDYKENLEVWVVKYRRKGWFQSVHVLESAQEFGEPYYTLLSLRIAPTFFNRQTDAQKAAMRVATEDLLFLWEREQYAKVREFWDRQTKHFREH